MKLKMLETYQGVGDSGVHESGVKVTILEAGEVYDVAQKLGEWLLENRKAETIDPPHYGVQKEGEERHDDKLYEEMTGSKNASIETESEVTEEAPEEPVMHTKKPKRGSK